MLLRVYRKFALTDEIDFVRDNILSLLYTNCVKIDTIWNLRIMQNLYAKKQAKS